jgi:hypothetical protein
VYVRLLSLFQEINSASLNTQNNTQKFVFAAVVKYKITLTKFMNEDKMAVIIAMNTTYCNSSTGNIAISYSSQRNSLWPHT